MFREALFVGSIAWLLGIASAAVSSNLPPDMMLGGILLLLEGFGVGLVSFAVWILALVILRAHPDRFNKSALYTAIVGAFLLATQIIQAI